MAEVRNPDDFSSLGVTVISLVEIEALIRSNLRTTTVIGPKYCMVSAILRGYSRGLEITTHERKPAEILRKLAQRDEKQVRRKLEYQQRIELCVRRGAVCENLTQCNGDSASVECATITTGPPPDRL